MTASIDPLDPSDYRDLVRRELDEDLGSGDVTTGAIVPADRSARGTFLATRACVVAGLDVARETFIQVDASVRFDRRCDDGDRAGAGSTIAVVAGPAAALLAAERTALNFLQHLSGIATVTRQFVDATEGRLTILDTRKTLPGMRRLAKYAVRCGGGTNHRGGLYDGVLIKDNHIRVAGGIGEAVRRVRARGVTLPIEVEAQSLNEVDQALTAGADVIMLDNLSVPDMRRAVERIRGRARIEISGGVTFDRLSSLVDLGADFVSIGALTHSAPAADISLELAIDGARP
jgi:nicotinate-nucleotide pyrophosphorylase (carboxylating)